MIETSVINAMKNDSDLIEYLETYAQEPAIFSDHAPEDANKPFIVINIEEAPDTFAGVNTLSLFINYFDFNKSRANSRSAAFLIQNIFDQNRIYTDERFDTLRFTYFGGSPVENDDPRIIQHNLQFTVRCGRKKWMEQI